MTPAYSSTRLNLGALLRVGLLTLAICCGVNALIRAMAVAFFGVSAAFQPLQLPTIIVSTLVYGALALATLMVVQRLSRQPRRDFRIVAGLCLLLSFGLPYLALRGGIPTPGMTTQIFWAMLAMHLLSGALIIAFLPTALARR